MVTARSGGASCKYFHTINSGGSCLDNKTGKIDAKKFKYNMELATEVYINWVNNSPCGDTNISLFEGPDSTELQNLREKVLLFLKSSRLSNKIFYNKKQMFLFI